MERLLIDLAELPEEGRDFAGELALEIFDLPDSDVRPLTPLAFRLHAQRFENELLLMGSLHAAFEFECVRTLTPFKKTISLENAVLSLEINDSSVIDATPELREELLLQFPSYPRCDEGDDPLPCEIDPRYLAVDKAVEGDVDHPPPPQGDTRWGALDAFQEPESQP